MAELFRKLADGKDEGLAKYQNVPLGRGALRAIPIGRAIKSEQKTVPHEMVKTYLDQSDYYSVADCACRKAAYLVDDACEHPWKEMCLQIGEEAEYYVRTGRGRRVTREEAEAILDKAERAGLVHQIFNNEGAEKSSFICNCCGCSCMGLRSEKRLRLPDFSRSNYVAEVDPENCVACGACVTSCNMGALKLGTKFCDIAEQTPKMDKYPAEALWTPEDADPDWRKRIIVNDFGTSPCETKCHAHISIQGYISKAAKGKYDEALKVIKRDNPFPAICGRVCPRSCEEERTRAKIDEAIAIDDIKKFIADKELQKEARFIPAVYEHHPERVAVIGSGPAGLSCAYYLAAEGYPVTVFEKGQTPGGMMMLGIPSFRLEKDVVQAEIDVLRELGVEFKTGVEVGKDVTIAQLRVEGYKAFYVAIGLQNGGKLGVSGDDAGNVIAGADFMKKVNRGEEVKLSGKVVVIGGGNIAADVARTAVRCGAGSVEMYCLESLAEMPCGEEDRQEVLDDGITIHNNWGPAEIASENGVVSGIRFKKCTKLRDENGRFAPQYDENDTIAVDASYVLYCIGQKTKWGTLLAGSEVKLNPNGTVQVDTVTYQTGDKDIFAGGDAVTGQKFVIDAIAGGKSGAISIDRFLQGRGMKIFREKEFCPFDKEHADYSGYDTMPRQRPLSAPQANAKKSFKDLRGTFSEEQLQKEAHRCLGCGVTVVDPWMCIGCGVCATKCEFDAIHLKKVAEKDPAATPMDFVMDIKNYAMQRYANIRAKAQQKG